MLLPALKHPTALAILYQTLRAAAVLDLLLSASCSRSQQQASVSQGRICSTSQQQASVSQGRICSTSQQQASVSLGRISLDKCTCGVLVSTSTFLACHQCVFESGLGLDFSGFSKWHLLKLVTSGVSPGTPLSSPPSVNGSADKIKPK